MFWQVLLLLPLLEGRNKDLGTSGSQSFLLSVLQPEIPYFQWLKAVNGEKHEFLHCDLGEGAFFER
jgi:hypothetical protein